MASVLFAFYVVFALQIHLVSCDFDILVICLVCHYLCIVTIP